MEARKFATQMAAICPFALVLGMGYSARQPVLGHTVLQYSDAQNERIEAYRPLVANVPGLDSNATLIRRHSDLWIQLAPLARLQALTPAFQEDMSEENVRSEIIGQWRWLEGRLNHEMRLQLVAGNFAQAVEDGTRIIRLSEILKYSDFDTMHLASALTTRTVSVVGPLLGKVSRRDRLRFNSAVGAVNLNRGKLTAMYNVIKANYEDFLTRRIGFGPEQDLGVAGPGEDEGAVLASGSGRLQKAYVSAISDEVKFRSSARTFLGLVFNPVKS